MITAIYQNHRLDYDEEHNIIYIDGNKDTRNQFKPSFVDNGEGELPTFIGFIDTRNGKYISLNGKEFDTIKPEDVSL